MVLWKEITSVQKYFWENTTNMQEKKHLNSCSETDAHMLHISRTRLKLFKIKAKCHIGGDRSSENLENTLTEKRSQRAANVYIAQFKYNKIKIIKFT